MKTGLTKWMGKAKDSKGCEFPYRCWKSRWWFEGELVTERHYDCPWWTERTFETLAELREWVSSK